VLVVGGGTAGAVVAGRLVEAGLRVQVLEAGPDYGTLSGGRRDVVGERIADMIVLDET
jgi:choline dehydrogenase